VIEVVAVDDSSGQFLGEMPGGRRGWFPRDFVEIIGMQVRSPCDLFFLRNVLRIIFAEGGSQCICSSTKWFC
jgi:hypothetical protein